MHNSQPTDRSNDRPSHDWTLRRACDAMDRHKSQRKRGCAAAGKGAFFFRRRLLARRLSLRARRASLRSSPRLSSHTPRSASSSHHHILRVGLCKRAQCAQHNTKATPPVRRRASCEARSSIHKRCRGARLPFDRDPIAHRSPRNEVMIDRSDGTLTTPLFNQSNQSGQQPWRTTTGSRTICTRCGRSSMSATSRSVWSIDRLE